MSAVYEQTLWIAQSILLRNPDFHHGLLEEDEDEEWLDNPIMGAEELLRFSRIRQLLHQ